ncbi:MAG: hypothetical protein GF330_12140 [Candidatus Eisenbacteria bacterium]|nr:hypothetical protein [Candidatus Eisenbacteria bacterium]
MQLVGSSLALIAALLISAASASAEPERATRQRAPISLWWLGDQEPLFAEALSLAGLDFAQFRFDPRTVGLWRGDRYRLPLFDLLFHDAWGISPHSHNLARRALRSASSVADLT